MSDMFFDTDTFDFNMISDIVDESGNRFNINDAQPNHAKPTKAEPTPRDLMIDDASDLFGDSNPEFHDDEYRDYNEDSSDLERPINPNDSIRVTDYFNSAPDDAVLTVGNWEGTKADLANYLKKAQKVEKDADYFKNAADEHEAISEGILKRGFMGKIAIEQNIQMLQRRLNQNLNDAEWRQTQQDLQLANAALQNLHNDVNQAWNARQQQEQITNYNRMYIADQALSGEIPNWEKYQPAILAYARDTVGIPNSTIEKVYDKGLATALFKAYLYDQNKSKIAEQMKAKQTAVNPRSTKSARNSQVSDTDAAKAKHALSRMGTTRDANVKAFAYLKD